MQFAMDNRSEPSVPGRKSFQRQPARAILVDLSPPLDTSSCHSIQESLLNTLTLVNHLLGPERLPLVTIIILSNYPECILPLQPVKGNFSRVLAALNELKTLTRNMVARHPVRGCILEGLQEALAQFSRMSLNSKQGAATTEFPSQIEVTLITPRSPSYLQNLVENIADHLDLVHLRKISAVVVTNPDRLTAQDHPAGLGGSEEKGSAEQEDTHMSTSVSDLAMNILDVTVVENDSMSLQNSFRSWLHDCGTDSEHLHLLLPCPPSHPQAMEGEDEDYEAWRFDQDRSGFRGGVSVGGVKRRRREERELVLKCDVQERILDPLTAFDRKIGDQFSLHISSPVAPSPAPGMRGTVLPLPTYKLRAVYTVPAEGVCESLVFGVPMILRPTSCWKLEWEELENNQQYFQAFCKLLTEQNLVVVTQAEHTPPPFTPYFLILPSPTAHTLLVKSVAPGELVLPSDLQAPEEEQSGDSTVTKTVKEALDMLEQHTCYNPLLVQSGFHEALFSQTLPKRGKRGLSRDHGGASRSERGRGASKSTFQPPIQIPPLSSRRGGGGGRGRGARGGRSLGTNRRGYNKGYLELRQ